MSEPTRILAELRRECAQDKVRAEARAAMADLLDYTVQQLRAQGFAPDLSIVCGMIELRFDADRVEPPKPEGAA